ncbi:MAG: hypothetical protein ACYDES_08950 [Acidimicrobiales bacterium]
MKVRPTTRRKARVRSIAGPSLSVFMRCRPVRTTNATRFPLTRLRSDEGRSLMGKNAELKNEAGKARNSPMTMVNSELRVCKAKKLETAD